MKNKLIVIPCSLALLLLIFDNQQLNAQINIQSSKDPYALHTYYVRRTREYRTINRKNMAESFWKDSDVDGKIHIEVDLKAQVAHFYKGEELVGQAPVSTGMEGYETKAGEYTVLAKEPDHVSNLYGEFVNGDGRIVGFGKVTDVPPRGTHYEPSPMPFFLRLGDDGLGLHAGFLPGYPASHGCIRLPREMAKHFYEAASIGTPVSVIGENKIETTSQTPRESEGADY